METIRKEQLAFAIAKNRIEKLKKFYKHLLIYVVVNVFLSTTIIISELRDGSTFTESFFEFKTFAIWIYWGAGIAFQALRLFGSSLFFSKGWEEKKIKEFMSHKNRENGNKF
jgi:formate-dependent nitrite reductase membrane component NrfD